MSLKVFRLSIPLNKMIQKRLNLPLVKMHNHGVRKEKHNEKNQGSD